MALHFGKRELEQPKTLSTGMAGPRYGQPGTPLQTQQQAHQPAGRRARGEGARGQRRRHARRGQQAHGGPQHQAQGRGDHDCDTLVVEGTVEATMDSRVIQIAEQGAFRGAAEIDIAEIRGEFSGTLTARHKLVIHGTGKVSGKVRYGKLVIEEGGQLSGEVEWARALP